MCEAELESVRAHGDGVGGSVRERLALAFRREKARCVRSFARDFPKHAAVPVRTKQNEACACPVLVKFSLRQERSCLDICDTEL